MAYLIVGMGSLVLLAGLIAGFIVITNANNDIEKIVGISLIVEGVIVGIFMNAFAYLLGHIEIQTQYLKDIRNYFYSDKSPTKETINEKELINN